MLVALPAAAHAPSDAQLRIQVDGARIEGRLDVPVRDLDGALVLDSNGDGAVTWGELSASAPMLADYIEERLDFAVDGERCPSSVGDPGLADLSAGPHWSVPITAICPRTITTLTLRYRLLFDSDALHRGVIRIEGSRASTLVARDAAPIHIALDGQTSVLEFVREGIWHIWHGLDHVLFLVCLLLPAVYAPSRGGRRAELGRESPTVQTPRTVAFDVLGVVTAFTLAHSITLVISTAGFVSLPSRHVETAIALSVVAAALNNLVRLVDARWSLAFALGLLHGFGFSSVLADLGLTSHELMRPLIGFNLGVELGQLVVVLALLPVLFLIRKTLFYRLLLWGGSAMIAVIASVWSFQRWFS